MDLVIRNGLVVLAGEATATNVGIADGKISQIGGVMTGTQEIDATGKFVLPGGVDPHVHLSPPRTGPGVNSWTDDFEIGSRAALAG